MAKLTDPNLRYERMQENKSIREMEYGILYPDGTIEWKSGMYASESLEFAQNRDKVREDWDQKIKQNRLVGLVPPLRFVSRIRKTSFSDIVPIA